MLAADARRKARGTQRLAERARRVQIGVRLYEFIIENADAAGTLTGWNQTRIGAVLGLTTDDISDGTAVLCSWGWIETDRPDRVGGPMTAMRYTLVTA